MEIGTLLVLCSNVTNTHLYFAKSWHGNAACDIRGLKRHWFVSEHSVC